MKTHVKILLVDDHPVVRRGICSCLAKQHNLSIVGEAADGHEALCKARELSPDIVLMDIEMPRMTGLAATEVLRRESPQTKVVVLSVCTETRCVMAILQSGAHGYIAKAAGPEELVQALETVQRGETFFSADIASLALTQMVGGGSSSPPTPLLTSRERDVLVLLAEGLCNKEVASTLGIGVRTIETHRANLMRKLGINTVAGLTKFAISQRLISIPR